RASSRIFCRDAQRPEHPLASGAEATCSVSIVWLGRRVMVEWQRPWAANLPEARIFPLERLGCKLLDTRSIAITMGWVSRCPYAPGTLSATSAVQLSFFPERDSLALPLGGQRGLTAGEAGAAAGSVAK